MKKQEASHHDGKGVNLSLQALAMLNALSNGETYNEQHYWASPVCEMWLYYQSGQVFEGAGAPTKPAPSDLMETIPMVKHATCHCSRIIIY